MDWREATRRIKRNDLPALRLALESGLDPNLANRFGWTLLMAAALDGVTPAGRLLLEFGAKVEPVNKFGDTALGSAMHNAHVQFARLLLEHGASLQPFGDWPQHREWLRNYSRNTDGTLAELSTLVEKYQMDNASSV